MVFGMPVYGQVFLMDGYPISTCSGFLLDSGGNVNTYTTNEDLITRICPDIGGLSHVEILINTLDLGSGDILCVHDGPDASAPLLACIDESQENDFHFFRASASNVTGCLTLHFTSDGVDQGSGWRIEMNCSNPCQRILSDYTTGTPTSTDSVINACAGDDILFNALAVYPENGFYYNQHDTLTQFVWTFSDGYKYIGQQFTRNFPQSGAFEFHLNVTDQEGCSNIQPAFGKVRISSGPSVNLSNNIPTELCQGDSLTLIAENSINSTADLRYFSGGIVCPTTKVRFDTSAMPDDGSLLVSQLIVNDFPVGATITGMTDLRSVCLNMEHSWVRDLDIFLVSPDNKILRLNQSAAGGNEIQIGTPDESDDALPQNPPLKGVGFDYCFSTTAPNLDLDSYASLNLPLGGTIPAGGYRYVGSINDLMGTPLNGVWKVVFKDRKTGDNGWLFNWSLEFDPILFPNQNVIRPAIVNYAWINTYPVVEHSPDSVTIYPTIAGNTSVRFLVTDEFGCTVDTTIDFNILPIDHPNCPGCNLNVDLNVLQDLLCFNDTIGLVEANVVGDNAPFQLNWSPGGVSNGMEYGDLSAGTYYLTVDDALFCSEIDSITFVNPPIFFVLSNSTPTLCPGSLDGTATAIANGGTGTYDYLWNDPAAQNTMTATGLNSGSYTVTVTDANQCIAVSNTDVVTADSIEIDSIVVDNVSCFGLSDGAAEVFVQGGNAGFTFAWNDPLSQFGNNAVFLAAGMYEVSVSDNNNCTQIEIIEVIEPDSFIISGMTTPITCFGETDGEIIVEVANGTSPYDFAWNTSGNPTDSILSAVGANFYTVTVTDNQGCAQTAQFQIEGPGQPLATMVSQTQMDCADSGSGEATVQIGGGGGGNTILWDNGEQSTIAINLAAGWHYVVITDTFNCVRTDSVLVVELDSVQANVLPVEPTCNGFSDGELAINIVSGGVGQGNIYDYTYEWSTIPVQFGLSAVGLNGSSSYSVTVIDAMGCIGVEQVFLNEPEPVISTYLTQDATCFGSEDGSAQVDSTVGGSSPYIYEWLVQGNLIQGDLINGLSAGNYPVTVYDDNNCFKTGEVLIMEPTVLEINIGLVELPCNGDSLATIQASGFGGTPNYQFSWSTGEGGAVNQVVTGNVYLVTVTDENMCTAIDTFDFQNVQFIDADFDVRAVSCFGELDGQIEITPTLGVEPFLFAMDNQEDLSAIPVFSGLEAGPHVVYIEDGNGCLQSFNLDVTEPAPILVDLGPDLTISAGSSIALSAKVLNAQGYTNYVWEALSGDTLNCGNCVSPEATPRVTSQYKLTIIDGNQCAAVDFVWIRVEQPIEVMVPTGFTPNGDGANDRLMVHGKSGIQIMSFEVYDRWGTLVYREESFEVNDSLRGWDGRFQNKVAQNGVYVWAILAEFQDGSQRTYKGHSTLIK